MKFRHSSEHALWRPKKRRGRAKGAIAIIASVGLAGGLCATIATAAVTSPTEGQVVRGGVVPITESVGGRRFLADGTTEIVDAASTTQAACTTTDATVPVALLTPAATVANKGIPYTKIQLFGPDDVQIGTDQYSPPRRAATSTFIFPTYTRGGPFTYNWTIPEDAVAGVYKAVVTVGNGRRVSTASTGSTTSQACERTTITTTRTFEYRPWQNKFKDVLGNGDVSFNLNPPEWAVTIFGKSTPVMSGNSSGGRLRAFETSDPDGFALPADPTTCSADLVACLPSVVLDECAPGEADCVPRIVTLNWNSGADAIAGVFDLETKAFIASVNYMGNRGTLFSLGTDGDAAVRELLLQVYAVATEQGIDLQSLLATKVKVTVNNGGESTVIAVSLLRALQIYTENPGGATGISIEAPITATIGLFAHSYSYSNALNPTGVASDVRGCSTARTAAQTFPGKCTASATPTASVGRFTPKSGIGYNVLKSDLLPDLPLPVLPALPPGLPADTATVTGLAGLALAVIPTKFFNIYGSWPNATAAHTPKIGVDTNPGEPHGLPVWIAPLSLVPSDPTTLTNTTVLLGIALQAALGLGLPSFKDKSMDFLGTASWATSETCTTVVCSGSGSMNGLGVGIFAEKALPIGFRNIPIWDPQSPEVVALIAQINQAIRDANTAGNEQIALLLADPTVQMVLELILGSLPEVPEVPEVPAAPVP